MSCCSYKFGSILEPSCSLATMMNCCVLKRFFQFLEVYSVSRKCILFCVYFALLLDNLLLTAVVPILPNFIRDKNEKTALNSVGALDLLKSSAEHFQRGFHQDASENQQLGTLLSLKAIVQLVANPLVAFIVQKRGFFPPLLFGTFNIIVCSLLFACGTTYEILSLARALHGLTSACFTVAGLGIVAANYKEETSRSSALGKALGGGAVGVLLGYPIGGFLYQLAGKTVPFLLITSLAFVLLVIVCTTVPSATEVLEGTVLLADEDSCECVYDHSKRRFLLAVAVGAIFLSTSVMALLEPCLPLWLLQTMRPERWQLGAVFIPDSCGYLLTTHFLGGFAYRFGRWKAALLAMLVLGICCCLIPLVPSIIYLSVPHFGIGAGIGTVDAALVPLLATLADNQETYGGTFALGQTAVGLAYCLGPLVGGMLVESVGFPNLMLAMGIANLLYTPLIIALRPSTGVKLVTQYSEMCVWKQENVISSKKAGYSRFNNGSFDES